MIGALVIWIIGICIINTVLGWIKKALITRDYNPTLNIFLLSLFGWFLKIILFFVIVD